MPSDFMLKTMNGVHRFMMTITGGRLGWEFSEMPVLELTTIGRKSGEPRSVMLTSPWKDGDNYVIVASRGGDDQHPAWFLNLRDHPDVKVRLKGKEPEPMRARITEGEERARLWKSLSEKHKNYAGYQTKTDREIPVVVLEPAG
jgi:deazaflavin-dependent oxidoreductase (nitroreductase family)